MSIKRLSQGGFNLVELMIAVGILAGLASAVMMARSYMTKQTVSTSDKSYATQKAIQMFEELKALVKGSENSTVNVLDNYSDGTNYNPVLTTDKNVDTGIATANPGNALSGNKATQGGHWRYLRQVQINHVPNDPNTRQVIIKVWLYQSDTNPTLPGALLSEVGGNLNTVVSTNPPTQVMDVYVLAINNIAGWWAHESILFQTYQNVINNIQNSNPGLVIRPHYITRTSYGRDSQYLPYINNYVAPTGATGATGATNSGGSIPYVYMYPGYTFEDTADGSVSDCFFDPGQEQYPGTPLGVCLDGNFNVGGGIGVQTTSQQFTGCLNYAVADQYNNSMRYPDELALYNGLYGPATQSGSVVPAGDSVTEISWRMLMEGMLDAPQSFQNALIVNLHGENLPLPPMRNYSDAAKDPGGVDNVSDTNIRVVTHPEFIYSPGAAVNTATVAVTLRVYAYYDGLNDISALDGTYSPANDPKTNISLFFPDLTVGSSTGVSIMGVTAIIGNSNTVPNTAPSTGPVQYNYDAFTIPANGQGNPVAGTYNGALADGTNLEGQGPVQVGVQYVGPNQQLLLTLYNTRLRCPNGPSTLADNNAGVSAIDRLYGLEYIPCSPDMTALTSPLTFTKWDLTYNGTAPAPKNTARWQITLSVPVTSTFASVSSSQPLTIFGAGGTSVVYTSPVNFIGQHTIETRIGTSNTNNAVPNLSRTYVWTGWGNPSARGVTVGGPPPTVEQYQFLGDPRHEPYLDVKVGGPGVAGQPATIQANGYNWWFKDGAQNGATPITPNMYTDGYRGFGQAGKVNGWSGSDATFADIPRFHQMIRQGLLNCTGIWTALNGYTYYYYAFGGEFGSDQPPFSNGITLNSTVYNTTAQTSVTQASEMVNWGNAQLYNVHIPANTTNTWYAKTWMGELYPDSIYTTWASVGNLPVATAAPSNATFYRQDYATLNTYVTNTGNVISDEPGQSLSGLGRLQSNRAGPNGCSSFYQASLDGTSTGGTMNHDSAGDTDTTTTLATNCYAIFGYPLPPLVVNNNGRPWHLNDTGNYPPQWGKAPFNTYNTLGIPSVGVTQRIFYTTSNNPPTDTGTGVVQITNSNNQVAYVVESGLSISAQIGSADLGETSLVAMLRTFLDGGNYSGTSHVLQVPLVELYCNSPNNQYNQPTNISMIVDGAVTTGSPLTVTGNAYISGPTNNIWYRYPGLTSTTANFYTEEYPGYPNLANSTYVETGGSGVTPISLDMNLLYSTNSGKTWQFMQDGNLATFGVLDTSAAHLITTNSFPYSYTWTGPPAAQGGFTQGNYELMVQAYRHNIPINYAYHILSITVDE